MSDTPTSLDEFYHDRKDFLKGDVVVKAGRAASSWNPDKRSIRFVMSSEAEDRDRDIIHQAGLNIEHFTGNPTAFFNHRSDDFPVGSWSEVEKVLTGRPKRTEGTLTLLPEGTEESADRLAKHFAAGSLRAASIGFIPKRVKKRPVPEDKKDSDYYWPGYDILEAEMVECSVVTVPSNPLALAKAAKDGDVVAREIIEEVLDTWAKDPVTGLLVPRKLWDEAWKKANGDMSHVAFMSNDSAIASAMLVNLQKAIHPVDGEAFADGAPGAGFEFVHQGSLAKSNAAPEPANEPPAAPDDPAAPDAAPAAPEAAPDDADSEVKQALPLLARLLKLFGNPQTEQAIEQELRDANLAAAEATVAEAARKEAISDRYQALETRLAEKGLT